MAKSRITMPWSIPREWSATTAENIQLNFERLFETIADPTPDVYVPPVIEAQTPPAINATRTCFEMWTSGTGVTMVGVPNTATTTGGAGASRMSPPFADAPYLQIGSAVLNATYTINAPTGTAMMMDLIWDFDVTFIVRTDANSASTLRRYIIGIAQGTPSADNPGEAGCYFRYSTAVPDLGWVGLCHDGTTVSSPTVAIRSIANSTRYALRIRKVANVCYFSIDGGPEYSVISNVPVATRTGVGPKLRLTNLDGNTMALYFSRAWVAYGT